MKEGVWTVSVLMILLITRGHRAWKQLFPGSSSLFLGRLECNSLEFLSPQGFYLAVPLAGVKAKAAVACLLNDRLGKRSNSDQFSF